MNTTILPPTLSDEENNHYLSKADAISKELGVSVYPVVFIDPDTHERVEAYIKEPKYIVKVRIMDKAVSHGIASASDELREATIIKEHSNALTYGEGPECDAYKIGLNNWCNVNLMKSSVNMLKKK